MDQKWKHRTEHVHAALERSGKTEVVLRGKGSDAVGPAFNQTEVQGAGCCGSVGRRIIAASDRRSNGSHEAHGGCCADGADFDQERSTDLERMMDIFLQHDGMTYEVPQDVLMRFRQQVRGLSGMTIDRDKRLEMVASCDGNEQRLLQLYVFLRYEHDMKPVQLSEVSCRILITAQRFNIFLQRMKATEQRGEPMPQRLYSLSR